MCPHGSPPLGSTRAGVTVTGRGRSVHRAACPLCPQPPQSQVHGSQLQVRRPRPPSSGNRSGKLPLTPHGKWAAVCSGGARPRGPPSLHAPPPLWLRVVPSPSHQHLWGNCWKRPCRVTGLSDGCVTGTSEFSCDCRNPPWGRKHGAYVSCLETHRPLPLCPPHPLHLVLL